MGTGTHDHDGTSPNRYTPSPLPIQYIRIPPKTHTLSQQPPNQQNPESKLLEFPPARPLETIMRQCKPKWVKFDAPCPDSHLRNMSHFHDNFPALQIYIRASSNHVSTTEHNQSKHIFKSARTAQYLDMASCPSSLCSFLKTWTKFSGNQVPLLKHVIIHLHSLLWMIVPCACPEVAFSPHALLSQTRFDHLHEI